MAPYRPVFTNPGDVEPEERDTVRVMACVLSAAPRPAGGGPPGGEPPIVTTFVMLDENGEMTDFLTCSSLAQRPSRRRATPRHLRYHPRHPAPPSVP